GVVVERWVVGQLGREEGARQVDLGVRIDDCDRPAVRRAAIDKPPLEPRRAGPARVGRGARLPDYARVGRAVTREDVSPDAFLVDQAQFVPCDLAVLVALVLLDVLVRLRVAKLVGRAAREDPALLLFVPRRAELRERGVRTVHRLLQLWERAPEEQRLTRREMDLCERPVEQGVGLAAARCAAVEHFVRVRLDERGLWPGV